jgi:hypothetical protein
VSDPIEEIRLRANAAQRGPWGWFGNAKYEFFLSTKDRGRIFVMQFGRMGMQSAQPCFNVNGRGMTDGRELAIYEVNRNATPSSSLIPGRTLTCCSQRSTGYVN